MPPDPTTRAMLRLYEASEESACRLDFLDWPHCDEAAAYLARQPADLDTLAQRLADAAEEEAP